MHRQAIVRLLTIWKINKQGGVSEGRDRSKLKVLKISQCQQKSNCTTSLYTQWHLTHGELKQQAGTFQTTLKVSLGICYILAFLNYWERPWGWERLRARREEGNRGWEVGCHHRLNGREFEQTPGDRAGQGSQAYCNLWGCKESDTT